MMTVVDPGGSPSVVYNRDGVTIDTIASAGTTQGTATPIVRYSGWTVVMVNYTGTGQTGIKLPDDAEIGDLVEIHGLPTTENGGLGLLLYPESGGEIDSNGANSLIPITYGLLRRTSAGHWYVIAWKG